MSEKNLLLLNNYNSSGVIHGELAGQHGFGVKSAPREWTIQVAPRRMKDLLRRLPKSDKIAAAIARIIGDPAQALWAAYRSRSGQGVVWVCTQSIAASVIWLRRIGAIRWPVIVLLHTADAPARQIRALRYADAVVTFSEGTATNVRNRFGLSHVSGLPWGPDLAWPPYGPEDSQVAPYDVVAFGKTHRDYLAIRKAARDQGWNAKFFMREALIHVQQGREVRITPRPFLTPTEVMSEIRAAKVVSIPVDGAGRWHGLVGLTELADAIAVGTPVIMPLDIELPFDIEEHGVGRWVAANAGVEEYASAMRALDDVKPAAFGDVLSWWNEKEFSRALFCIFDDLMQSQASSK